MIDEVLIFLQTSSFKLIGITGNAGAGKSSLSKKIVDMDNRFIHYSADYKFIGDSPARKKLLERKANNSIASYIDACNQYNWWNWDDIFADLRSLKNNKEIILNEKYNRETGYIEAGEKIAPDINSKIIFDGALLGNTQIVEMLDCIIFVYTNKMTRLNRLITKDIKRRSLNDILARFLITEYSESKHYSFLFEQFKNKIFLVNDQYDFVSVDKEDILQDDHYIPLIY